MQLGTASNNLTKKMKKTAILIGATGLTGSLLLKELIEDNRYEKIKLFSRKKIENLPSKVVQIIGDILDLEKFKNDFTGDVVFCCIGTTSKKTPDKALYKHIDYGIPVTAAKLAKANHISTFVVVSALGANAKSHIFYNKTKGEMERDVLHENIAHTYILQPSLIVGNRNESRILERMGIVLFQFISPLFIGNLTKYKAIEAKTIAKAMLILANSNKKTQIVTSDKIKEITKK